MPTPSPLYPPEQRTLDAALALAATLGPGPTHTVAAAVMDTTGRIFTGVNVHHFTGGPCAEVVAVGAAATAGAGPLMTVAAAGGAGRGVLSPCGRCRQTLLDLHPDCLVVLPTPDGPGLLPVRDLLPFGYAHPDADPERLLRFAPQYRAGVSAGRKRATTRYRDPARIGPTWLVFEDDEHPYPRLPGVVERIEHRTLATLTEQDARAEGASSADALRAGLRGHYPGITDDAPVELVHFRVADHGAAPA
ncbi:MAG TPA: ASCH domain-containing protein [Cellulomonas sp.]